MNIQLVKFDNTFVPPADGKYLVRVEEELTRDMKQVKYKQAYIKKYEDKDKIELYTIDVDNNIITDISKEPLA